MNIKDFFSKAYAGRKAQSALELSVGGMILVSLIGAIVSQGWGFSFANYNSYRAMRQALTLSYKYSYGAFEKVKEDGIALEFNPYDDTKKGTGYSGSGSRLNANVIIVEDRLSPSGMGKYGAINRSPLMVQSSGSMTANFFMPQTKPIKSNLPRIDVFVNGKHFPFTVAGYRTVNLYRPNPNDSPFWEKYCLAAKHFQTIMVLDADGNVNPVFAENKAKYGLPIYATVGDTFDRGDMIIDEDGEYVGPTVSDSGENIPHPLNAFVLSGWRGSNFYYLMFLDIKKYPNAPWVGCMRLYSREYNQAAARRWCDGQGNGGSGGECPHVCANERFDLDLSDQMKPQPMATRYNPPIMGYRLPLNQCTETNDVPNELRPYFSWQWFPIMAVADDKEDDNNGTYGVKEDMTLRYGVPMKSHDYVDIPISGEPGEDPAPGVARIDRDLEEEQVMKFLYIDRNFGIVEKVLIQDMQNADLNFSANDDEEVGFYFGKDTDLDGLITTQAPVTMRSELQGGTYMSVEDTPTQIITTRQKQMVDAVQRIIKLSKGATSARWCNPTIDGEPNPVVVCGNCMSQSNKLKTCFEENDQVNGGGPSIYVRTIIADKRGLLWVADKK